MNTWRFPAFVLVLLYLGFLGGVVRSAFYLPTQLASHFNAAGEPDGWMPTEGYLQFIALLGGVLPLVFLVVPQLLRFMPTAMVNLPHRDYWLAPARRPQTIAYLVRHFLWFSCLQVGLAGGVHLVVFFANRMTPPRMSVPYMLVVLAFFLVGVGLWTLSLYRHFQRGVPEKHVKQAG